VRAPGAAPAGPPAPRRRRPHAPLDTLTQRVDALAEAQQRTEAGLGTLTQRVDALTQRVDALTQRVDALTQRVDALTQHVSELVEQMALLVRRVGKLEETTGWLVGDAMERRYREKGPVYFRAIARRLRTLEFHEVDHLLEEAVDAGAMTEADADQVRLADAIMRGRRREDAVSVYLVLEASAGVGLDDVQRAYDRAALLSRTGTPSIPVVAGEWVTDTAAEAARGMGVWQVTDGRAVAPERTAR
jgi:polyhydroxyalkanoate synthesis regulator phasin